MLVGGREDGGSVGAQYLVVMTGTWGRSARRDVPQRLHTPEPGVRFPWGACALQATSGFGRVPVKKSGLKLLRWKAECVERRPLRLERGKTVKSYLSLPSTLAVSPYLVFGIQWLPPLLCIDVVYIFRLRCQL